MAEHLFVTAPTDQIAVSSGGDRYDRRMDAWSEERYRDRVLEGDCLTLMPHLPDGSIDMVLCDLPYGTTQNAWDSVLDLDALWAEYERVVKPDGAIVLTAQGLFTAQLMLSRPRLFKYKVTWVKSKATNFLNAKRQPLRKHEDVLVFYRRQPTYHPDMWTGEPYTKGTRKDQLTGSYGDFGQAVVKSDDGLRYPTDVVYFKTAESEGAVFHPTQKPISLGRYLVRTYTDPGDLILDNACGSGSFLVAAALEGRSFVGMELNDQTILHKRERVDMIDVCERRIALAREQLLLPGGLVISDSPHDLRPRPGTPARTRHRDRLAR